MKARFYSFVLLFVFMPAAAFSQSVDKWTGTYTFDEDGGKNVGGTTIFVSHELTVLETDDGLIATVKSNGYQTSIDLNCKAIVQGSKLLLYFESYGEDNIFENYKPGDLLFTLEKRMLKGKASLLTFWGKFLPIVPKNEKTGRVYFVRSNEIETN